MTPMPLFRLPAASSGRPAIFVISRCPCGVVVSHEKGSAWRCSDCRRLGRVW